MTREYWLQNENLTAEDLNMLLQSIHPKLLDMEHYNLADAYWNDIPFRIFLLRSLDYMLDIIEKDLGPSEDIEYYYRKAYPKIKQFWDYEEIINLVDVEKTMVDTMNSLHLSNIYEVIELWWNFRIEEFMEANNV
jgi:hypothetical protein